MWELVLGGILGSMLNGGNGGTEMTGQTTQTMPDWQEDLLKQISGSASTLAGEGYTPYPGPRIADFTDMQNQSFSAIQNAAGANQPFTDLATRVLGQAPGGWDQAAAQKYMNPYTGEVIDRSMSEINRQGLLAARDIEDRMAKTGNFGGARHGVADAEHQRNILDVKANTIAGMNHQNYMQAFDAFTRDRAGLQGLAQTASQIGGATQQQGLAGAGALGAAGSLQQLQNQSHLDLAYNDFQKQQQHPYNQINWLSNVARGFPSNTGTTTTYSPQPSPLQQVAGLGLAGFGMFAGAPQGSWANTKMNQYF